MENERANELTVVVLTPSDGGGMLHYSSQMSSALGEWCDVTVIVDEGADTTLFENVDVVELDFPGSVSEAGTKVWSLWYDLYNRLSDSSVDVVHATVLNPLLVAPLLALRNQQTVLTLHDPSDHLGAEKRIWELARRSLVRAADQVVVHGEYNASQCEAKYGIGEKLLQINHGEYSFFRDYCDAPVTYDRELLFFGRIRPYKGVETLLAADERISEVVDDYQLTIAGNGPLDVTEEELGAHVRLLNEFIPNEQVCELFSQCRAVVLPYREATQSGIVPIAYAFRKPVIATTVGGLPEVVVDGTTGALVPPDEPSELAIACGKMLENRVSAEERGSNAYDFMSDNMGWDRISTTIIEGYMSES